jgi:hypothetical protein
MNYLYLTLLLLQVQLFAQEFQFSDMYSQDLTTNQHTSEVYFKNYFSLSDYYVADLHTMDIRLSEYNCLPVFSYKTNKMIYRDSTYLHLIDYDRGTNNALKFNDTLNYNEQLNPFSPNEELALLNLFLYTFKDNSLRLLTIDSPYMGAKWSSDSTIIVLREDKYSFNQTLVEYSINSSRRDTLFNRNLYKHLHFNWEYDIKRNKLYYSTIEQNDTVGYITKLWVFDRYTKTDSILYEYPKDRDPNCYGWVAGIYEIKWSGNYDRMIFLLGYIIDISATNIFAYFPDSNKIIKTTNGCEHYGSPSHIYWANYDTLVYNDVSRSGLFGIRVPEITGIVKEDVSVLPIGYFLSNYPNPFNGSTIIEYQMLPHETGELQIFNILGKKIISFDCGNNSQGKNKITWNGKDSYGKIVSSGIYFAVLQLNKSSTQIKPLKLVYLK